MYDSQQGWTTWAAKEGRQFFDCAWCAWIQHLRIFEKSCWAQRAQPAQCNDRMPGARWRA